MINSLISTAIISTASLSTIIPYLWPFVYSGIAVENFEISDCTLRADDSIGGLVGVINNVHQRSRKSNFYGSTAKNNQYLRGYNVLTKNLKFEPYTEGKHIYTNSEDLPSKTTTSIYEPFSVVFAGYICGFNEKAIQITGYSRQNDDNTITMLPDLVGYSGTMKRINSNNDMELTGKYDNPFGTYYNSSYNTPTGITDGFVIFADYNDAASTEENKQHANIYPCENDVIEYTATGSKTTEQSYTVIAQKDENGNSIIQSITPDGAVTITTSETPESGLSAGQQNVSVTGEKIGYESIASSTDNLVEVTSADELTATDLADYYVKCVGNSKYLQSTTYGGDNAWLNTTNSLDDAALWYFKPSGNTEYPYFICTDINRETYYLSRRNGKGGFIYLYKEDELRANSAIDPQFTTFQVF